MKGGIRMGNKESKNIKGGYVIGILALLITTLSNLILTPTIIKHIGSSEYGAYRLIASFVTTMSIMDLGLGSTVIRYVAEYRISNDKEKIQNLINFVFLVFIIISLLTS